MKRLLLAGACAATLGACGGRDEPVAAPSASSWRSLATDRDRDRLRGWRDAWMAAVAKAKVGGHATAIAAQKTLFDPDLALEGAVPPPGSYRCRTYKLGGAAGYVEGAAETCIVDQQDGVAVFRRQTGMQRPAGHIFRDDAGRAVFLGTLALGDETRGLRYGFDGLRDMAGYVDRIDNRRWRITLPWPNFDSDLDVIELVPVS